MRKLRNCIFLASLLCFSQYLTAQKTDDKEPAVKKNVIKLNLSSLVLKNISVQYERALKKKMSVALGVSFMPKSSLPFANTLKEEFADNADAQRAIESTRLQNFSITPELRFYLGKKKAPNGFYIAPYARYLKMSFDQIYQFTTSAGKVHNPQIKGEINNFGGGLMFGAQWNLSKSITLDWWILGAHYGTNSGTLTGTDDMSDMTAADRAKLKQDIEDVDIPLTDLEATVGNNRVDVKLDGPYAGVRGFGFALGIKF